jgi:hypothetical protein
LFSCAAGKQTAPEFRGSGTQAGPAGPNIRLAFLFF